MPNGADLLLREKAAVMQHIVNVQMFWETQKLGSREKERVDKSLDRLLYLKCSQSMALS